MNTTTVQQVSGLQIRLFGACSWRAVGATSPVFRRSSSSNRIYRIGFAVATSNLPVGTIYLKDLHLRVEQEPGQPSPILQVARNV